MNSQKVSHTLRIYIFCSICKHPPNKILSLRFHYIVYKSNYKVVLFKVTANIFKSIN